MPSKKNVLVFPCGSEIGLEIYRSLQYSTHFEIFGGSTVEDHGMYVYKNYVHNIPLVDDEDFIGAINKVAADFGIDFIIPAHDSVVLKLAQAKQAGKLKCEVITSPLETCEIARSKLQTYHVLEGIVPVPKVYRAEEVTEHVFPVFLKPEVGQGSKGTYLARNSDNLSYCLRKDPGLLVLQYLQGKEYTVDCFTDRNGKLLVAEGRERGRISNGISVNSKSVQDERFRSLAERINQKLTFRGVWFFQVKEDDNGELVLMEIAPRVAGTMGLIRCRGINLVLLSLFDALSYDVAVFENSYSITIDRALQNLYRHDITYDHVYIDLDDLILHDEEVNILAIAFVYQCINKGIALHLITRHQADISATLAKHRLGNVFDEIILVDKDDEKHPYITEKDAIFIDDSFDERKKIHDQLHIPTFDTHAIESLIEKT